MKYMYFKINATFPDAQANELNTFVASHSVFSVKEHFVNDRKESFYHRAAIFAYTMAKKSMQYFLLSDSKLIRTMQAKNPELLSGFI